MTPAFRRPPRIPGALVQRWVPEGAIGRSVVGDLHEEWIARGAGFRAYAWYWGAAATLATWYVRARLARLTRGRHMMDLRGDARTALRMIARNPGSSTLMVATLALAIGGATIAFAFADLALLRGLPVDDASRVVGAFTSDTRSSQQRGLVSSGDFVDYKARSRSLTAVTAFRYTRAALVQGGESRTLDVVWTTPEFFVAMGQPAVRGRVLAAEDGRPGASGVAVLTHRYWQESFSGRDDAIGRELQIGRDLYTIVGVSTPELEFASLAEIDVWLPMVLTSSEPRDVRNLRFIARLEDGVTFDQAAAELAAIGDALATEHPRTNAGWRVRLVPVSELTGGDGFWVVIALFMLSIAFLMAIATANVSNLALVRSLGRQRELAVRTALGARRSRLVRQLLVEGLALSTLAALAALPVAWLGLRVIPLFSAEPVFNQLRVDSHELLFVAALALVCPLAFSLGPARAISRLDTSQVLAAGGVRGTTATHRGRAALVVSQIALTVILLTASTLAMRSVRHLYSLPTGIDTAPLLIFALDFNDAQYPAPAEARAAAVATRDRLAEAHGVSRAAMFQSLPILGAEDLRTLDVDGHVRGPDEAAPTAVITATTADAAAALGVTLLAGEWWTPSSDHGVPDIAVVSRETAVRYLGGVDKAVGRRLTVAGADGARVVAVAGVVNDVVANNRELGTFPRVWMPLDESTRRIWFALRTASEPSSLSREVRELIASTAPAIPIEDLETFDSALRQAESSDYLVVGVLGCFGVLALVLASTGLFGVVSYSSSQRKAEFGTRIALGASATAVVRMVMTEAARLLAVGLVVGLAGGVAVGMMMRGALFGIAPTDPTTLSAVAALLTFVMLAAAALPAWRASRTDPVQALRE